MGEFKYQYNELQRKWLDDLKTTTAPQTREYLQRIVPRGEYKVGFCCLGRACVVSGLEGVVSRDLETVDFGSQAEEGENCPPQLAKDLKLHSTGGRLLEHVITDESGEVYNLVGFNDNAHWTFKQIAEYIEANPDNVFSDYEDQKKEWIAKQNEAAGNDIISFTRVDRQSQPGDLPIR